MNCRMKRILVGVFTVFFSLCAGYCWLRQTQQPSVHESFFKRFINNPTQVGAIAESSEALAEAITTCTQPLSKEKTQEGRNILEVGAGTGVFTQHIINKMGFFDTLDIVEYDPVFYAMLKERFGKLRHVNIYCCSIEDFNPNKCYDYIISGLPFNAFPSELVEKILNGYKRILKKDGTVAYFEYIALPMIKRFGLSIGALFSDQIKKEKNDFDQTLSLVKAFRKSFELEQEESVGLNLPPARAVTCSHLLQ